ncbi:MAG: indolepyruvate ferredoxin oxidoreductase subunit alpha [bacterium]
MKAAHPQPKKIVPIVVAVAEAEQVPLTGNEAIARGAWEAGVRTAAAYPGTPSTEILETLATFPAEDVHAQWSTNEKVASDVAFGASLAGVRALAAMKHVGVNVAADSIMSLSYIGVNGGLVFAVCDDPGIHSSQNEQDTRLFARWAMVPVLEPSDAQEALDFTRMAFELSEKFDTPIIVRSTTRLAHTRSLVTAGSRQVPAPKKFIEDPSKNVMIPAYARLRHPMLFAREEAVQAWLEQAPITRWEKGAGEVGIITLSTAYTYVKEVLPGADVLKLGAAWPLPVETIRRFCASVERVLVVEELEPMIEEAVRGLGIAVAGKQFFPRVGELSPELVHEGLAAAGVMEAAPPVAEMEFQAPPRPPLMCAGCPHVSSFLALRALGARVAGDIGCYTLAVIDPLKAMHSTIAMGCSIGNAVGMAKSGSEKRPVVATLGDSTFLHAGIPPLIDAVYNQANITVVLLDNHITAMTGGQDHPGTGRTLRGEETHRVDFEQLIRAVGVQWVRTIDSYDLGSITQTLREAMEFKGVSVVISDRPCVLDPQKIKGPPFTVVAADCNGCQSCMNLGCPALVWSDEWFEDRHKVRINEEACMGCTFCVQVCIADCIKLVESKENEGNQGKGNGKAVEPQRRA